MPENSSSQKVNIVEVLVIIFALVIILAFFLPFFLHTNGKTPKGTCMSHMRQLDLALMMTAQDNKEIFPVANEWTEKCKITGDSLFDCPSTEHRGTKEAPDYLYMAVYLHQQNGLLSNRSLNDIQDTSATPELVELADPGKVGQTSYVSDVIKINATSYGYDPQAALFNKIDRFRHDGGSIVAFVDGHVEYLKAKKVNMALLTHAMLAKEPIIRRLP